MKLILRGLHQSSTDQHAKIVERDDAMAGLNEILSITDFPYPEPVIAWKCEGDATAHLAALDIDWHGAQKPEPHKLDWAGYDAMPRPAIWWRTHGGGLRCIFTAADFYSAAELAAICAVSLLAGQRSYLRLGLTAVEIKSETRHPGYRKPDGAMCGEVKRGNNGYDLATACNVLLGRQADVDPEAIDEWLQEQGMQRNVAYEHDRCPVDSSYPSHGKPVWVGDYGVFCQSCDAHGKCGFTPWATLLDSDCVSRKRNRLRDCVRGLCHWEHARHVVAADLPLLPARLGQLVYRALLKLCHLSKPKNPQHADGLAKLIDKVFFPSIPIIRSRGFWAHADDLASPYSEKPLDKLLPCLPAVQYVTDKGEHRTDRRKHGIFQSDIDLTEYGYPAIEPLRGCDLRGGIHDEQESAEVVVSVVPAKRGPFKYMPKEAREQLRILGSRPEDFLKGEFPGLNLNLLKLLIAAKGFAQGQPIEPPIVMLTGQSGAAKTATALLAGELAFDTVELAKFTSNLPEFMMAIGTDCGRHGYVLLDEIEKAKASSSELQAALLSLKRGAQYRMLYAGYRTFGILPALVMADTALPPIMQSSVQLARRIVHVDIGAGSNAGDDWRKTCWV